MPSPKHSPFSDFTDIDAFTRIPRVTAVAAGGDGQVVASVSEADEHGSKRGSALWELDPQGLLPARRLTFSKEGESAPRFARDGSLLFTSRRPDPEDEAEKGANAVWRLPAHGEAHLVASAPGGLGVVGTADDGSVLATTSVLAGATLDDDAATVALGNASADLSPDGRTVATTWTERVRGGETRTGVVLIDTVTRERTGLLAADDHREYGSPLFSPDGAHLAVKRIMVSTPTDTSYGYLEIHPLTGGEPVVADLGDLTAREYTWSRDGTLLVAGDLHSSGAVLAVDPRTAKVRTLADAGVFTCLAPAPDGSLYALRSDVTTPPRPVRITSGGEVRELPAPGAVAALPGRLERVRTEVDGELAWLLGLYVSEGSRRRNQLTIANTDESILDRAERIIERFGVSTYRAERRATTACSDLLASIVGWLEIGDGAHSKRIPPIVFGWPRPLLEAFLLATSVYAVYAIHSPSGEKAGDHSSNGVSTNGSPPATSVPA